ncbi:hypothetical protein AB0N05_32815 [Nocardia sp. NPDC051030]|uniref:hypothetical protein n=1 Tax=Nocardia sp. NPDC051030 TaxID=3155162 RepID=UPI003426F048
MNARVISALMVATGAVAVSLTGVGVAQAQEFAAGVNCTGMTCTNDNDEPYTVSGVAFCLTNPYTAPTVPGQPPAAQTQYTNGFSGVVGPHSTLTFNPGCRGGDSLTGFAINGAAPGAAVPPSGSGG